MTPRGSGGEILLPPTAGPSSRQEWEGGWRVVLASFVGFSFLTLMTGSLSMFIEPIGNEFGWSRTLVASGFTIGTVISALLSPFVGMVIDKVGPRRVALPGLVATALIGAAFSLANGTALQWYLLWAAYAGISIFIKPTVWTAAVAGVFTRGRGLALGIAICGTGAAQTLLPPITHLLIEQFGWRAAYVWLSLGWGALAFAVAWPFFYGAQDRPKSPKAGSRAANTAERTPESLPGLTVAEAWRDPALWRVAASTLLIMMLTVGLTIHQVPILREAGISRGQAAVLASFSGIAAIGGKILSGLLLDRFRPNWVGGGTFAATALAFGLLIDGVRTPALIVFAMLVNGYAQGTKVQIVSYLTARYAGMKSFGTVFGVMNSIMAAGSGAGPILAGLVYDGSGEYTTFLIAGTFGSLLCGILMLTLPAYPLFQRSAAEPSTAG